MKIKLWDMDTLGIIIEFDSGVVYSNQTGGTACFHSEVEGVLCPLADDSDTQTQELSKLTVNKNCISSEDADKIDCILSKSPDTYFIKVDRDKLNQSWESWLHVLIDCEKSLCLENVASTNAVLTWPNSD